MTPKQQMHSIRGMLAEAAQMNPAERLWQFGTHGEMLLSDRLAELKADNY